MLRPEGFAGEGERLAQVLGLDFSVASMAPVEKWLAASRSDANAVLAGCYAGEVVRRVVGGEWQDDGTITGVGHVAVTMPLAKAQAGEDLAAYVEDVVRYAR